MDKTNAGGAVRHTEIAIVGGGLAGSLAAAMLALRGFDVVLVDPRAVHPPELRCEKLDGPQVALLQRTGLADAILAAGDRFDRFCVARHGRVTLERAELQYGVLYGDLVNRVRAAIPGHATVVQGTVTAIENGALRQRLTVSTGDVVDARLVVIANGLNSGLRQGIGITREVVSRCHSVTIAFDIRLDGSGSLHAPGLTYYGERPADRIAYLTLFPAAGALRANLMLYRDAHDPWIRTLLEQPEATLHRSLPGLAAIIGGAQAASPPRMRPADLSISHGQLQDGIVLVGDAFATSCPAAGTGTSKVFTDVLQLCTVHVPQWMRTPGMDSRKIAAFYADPLKLACDRHSLQKAFRLRDDTLGLGLAPRARRWARLLRSLALRGHRSGARPVAAGSRP